MLGRSGVRFDGAVVMCRVARTSVRCPSTTSRMCIRASPGEFVETRRRRLRPTRTTVRLRPSCSRRTVSRVGGVPGASDLERALGRRVAAGPRTRRSSTAGAPPIPMLPSSRSAVPQRPCPGTRSKIDRCKHRRAPRAARTASAGNEMSMPRLTMPASASASAWRAGSAADVEDRPIDSFEQAVLGRRDRLEPPLRRRGEDATVDRPQARSVRASMVGAMLDRALIDVSARAREPWFELCDRAGEACASARARRRRARRGSRRRLVRARSARFAARARAAGRAVAHAFDPCSSRRRRTRGRRVGAADAPPAAVEGRAEHRVGVVFVEHGDRVETRRPSSCGVSMPTRRAGPRTSANACASRSARPTPTWGNDIEVRAGATVRVARRAR